MTTGLNIGSIRTFQDVQRALNNLRSYITGLGSLVGPRGLTGPAGAAGSTWFFGDGAPLAATGAEGDYYHDTVSGNLYHKVGGQWGAPIAVLVVGGQATETAAADVSGITVASGADSIDRGALNTALATLVSQINAQNAVVASLITKLKATGLLLSS